MSPAVYSQTQLQHRAGWVCESATHLWCRVVFIKSHLMTLTQSHEAWKGRNLRNVAKLK